MATEDAHKDQWTIIEGIGPDILLSGIAVLGFLIFAIYRIKSSMFPQRVPNIHPESETSISETRERLQPRSNREHDSNLQCPVCLDNVQYGLETNCGHVFCGSCIITYWKTGRWLGPVACPNCRQTVTILMNYFTPDELREDDSELKNTVLTEVLNYNRRFSGEPRSVLEYIQDLPTVLRHAISDLFSVDGMVFIFRARIIVCLAIALLYLLSPLDLIPEMAVGVLGYLDDICIIFIIAIYITMIYRGVLANRAAAQPNHDHAE